MLQLYSYVEFSRWYLSKESQKETELLHVGWYSLISCLILKKKISVQNRFVLPMTFKIFNNGKKTELLFIYNR